MADFKNESTYKKFLESGKESEFDALFENAVNKVREEVLGKDFPIYINGEEVKTDSVIVQRSPINGEVMGNFQKGTREIAKRAVDAAAAAFESWSERPYKDRAAIMMKAASLFSKRKFEVSAILSIENGKSRYESVGEVDEAIDFLNYYAFDLLKNRGYVRKTDLAASTVKVKAGFQGAPGREEKVSIAMRPYGVFGVIAPFNFPISISTGMSTGALITGNTVVFKPSSTDNMTMLTGLEIYKIFSEAGVPNGVFNFVTGPGSEVGDELVVNPKVSGIAFTGSRSVGLQMIKKSYDIGIQKVYIMEMGGKNPVVVSKYSVIDDAVTGIASAAFGYAGQKCSAASRVYVHESIKEQFMDKLLEKTRSLKVGDPLKKESYLGPLISGVALERYKMAVQEAKQSGRVVFGGNQLDIMKGGSYVEPTIVEAEHSNRLFHEELFLPFLMITTYEKFEDALAMANDVPYGLTAGLYSKKKSEIDMFLQKMQSGVIYINRETSATTGAIVGLHTFVGWKSSGLTGKGSSSRFYLQQFMREQSRSVVKQR